MAMMNFGSNHKYDSPINNSHPNNIPMSDVNLKLKFDEDEEFLKDYLWNKKLVFWKWVWGTVSASLFILPILIPYIIISITKDTLWVWFGALELVPIFMILRNDSAVGFLRQSKKSFNFSDTIENWLKDRGKPKPESDKQKAKRLIKESAKRERYLQWYEMLRNDEFYREAYLKQMEEK